MNLNFNDDHLSIICIYQETKAPPKFCNSWGATSECEQIYIHEREDAIWHVIFTQQVKQIWWPRSQSNNLKQHMAIQNNIHHSHVGTSKITNQHVDKHYLSYNHPSHTQI